MLKPRWDSKRILSDLEHFEVFRDLFVATQLALFQSGGRTPWPNKPHQLSLLEVHIDFVEAVREIRTRKEMVAENGPLLMVKALFNAFCENFREPTHSHDHSRDPTNALTAKLLSKDSRALIILNFMRMVMLAVTFNHYNPAILNEEGVISEEEFISAIEGFKKNPDRALEFMEARVLRGMMS